MRMFLSAAIVIFTTAPVFAQAKSEPLDLLPVAYHYCGPDAHWIRSSHKQYHYGQHFVNDHCVPNKPAKAQKSPPPESVVH